MFVHSYSKATLVQASLMSVLFYCKAYKTQPANPPALGSDSQLWDRQRSSTHIDPRLWRTDLVSRCRVVVLIVLSRSSLARGKPLTVAIKEAIRDGHDLVDKLVLGRGRRSMFAGTPFACDPCWVVTGKIALPETIEGANGIELTTQDGRGLLKRFSEGVGGKHFDHMPADALLRVRARPDISLWRVVRDRD